MKKLFRVVLSLLLVTVQVVTLMGSSKIYAADLSDTYQFITGVQLTDLSGNPLGTNIAKDSDLRLTYNYAIPNTGDVKAGDTFVFQIPEQIKIEAGGSFDLLDNKGILIGTGTLSGDGTITITFSEYAEKNSNITGSFWFELGFDADKIGTDDPSTITFDVGGSTTPVQISVDFDQPAPLPASILKSGSYDETTNTITWTMTVNPENVSVNNAVVTDVISDALTFLDGTVTINGGSASGSDYTYNSNTFTYTFPSNITTSQTLTFQTKVNDSEFTSGVQNGGEITESNTATLSHDGTSVVSNEADVTVPVNFITKTGAYNASTRQIDWTITINQNGVSIPNAVVTDTLPDGLTLDTTTVQLDGSPSSSYTYTHPGIQFDFGAIAEKHTITYSTDVESAAYTSNVSKEYQNTAILTGTGVPAGTSGGQNVGVPSNIIRKEGVSYDRVTGEITWKITVNENQITIQNPIITDLIPIGQEYVTGSATIDNGGNTANFSYTAAAVGDTAKTGTLTYTFGAAISSSYTIEFQTKVTDPAVYAGNADMTYSNTGSIMGDNITESASTGTQKVKSEVLDKTGAGYDYQTRTITWKVVVNANQMNLGHAVFRDAIPVGMEYVTGSASIDQDGNVASFAYNAAVAGDTTKSGTLTYTFPSSINKTYTITFQTKVTDVNVFATNGAKSLTNTGVLTHDLVTAGISDTGTQTVQNTVISKTGAYTTGNKYIEWTVNINSNEVPLTDTVIRDQLQEGLALDTASVRLFHQSTAADGSLVLGEEITLASENVEYDLTTRLFTLHLPSPASGGYRLTFQTNVTDKSKSPFKNEATFNGTGSIQTGSSQALAVNWSGSGSTGSSASGSITVYKVDAENPATKLEGATFVLVDKYGNSIQQATTGAGGSVLFDMLRLDVPYTVREVTAPTGYSLNSTGYTFTIGSSDASKDISYQYEDTKIYGGIRFQKLGEDGTALSGAEFTLYDKDHNKIDTAVSTATGEVLFQHLEYGDYTIQETTPPEGYLISDQVLTASIRTNGVTVTANPASISNQTIKGNVKVTKISEEDGSVLSGAEFSLYASSDTSYSKPVASAVTGTDGTALFENVSYGSYYLRETKAPAGFQLSDQTLPVSVSENGKTYDLGNYSDTLLNGRIQIEKTDTEGNPLEDASFSLYRETDTAYSTPIAESQTDANGNAYFNDIPKGVYLVRETKAPVGYLLADTTKTVVVGKEAKTYDAGTIIDEKIKGSIEIQKVDPDGKPLKGAEFGLYNSEGKLVETASSDANGKVELKDIPYGDYTIKETAAPELYKISDRVIAVSIQEDGVTKKYRFVNQWSDEYLNSLNGKGGHSSSSKDTEDTSDSGQAAVSTQADALSLSTGVPKTGDDTDGALWMIVLLLSGGTVGYLLLGKRKKRRR